MATESGPAAAVTENDVSAAQVRAVLLGVADEYLHLGSSWVFNCVKVATAPLVLLMHATVPAVTPGARLPLATPCILWFKFDA